MTSARLWKTALTQSFARELFLDRLGDPGVSGNAAWTLASGRIDSDEYVWRKTQIDPIQVANH
jgi:hypothetical protein